MLCCIKLILDSSEHYINCVLKVFDTAAEIIKNSAGLTPTNYLAILHLNRAIEILFAGTDSL